MSVGEGRRRARVFLWMATAFLAVLSLWMAWEIRGPLVMALVIGYLLQPLHARLVPIVRRPWVSGLLLTVFALALLVLPVVVLGVALAGDVQRVGAAAMEPGGPEALVDGLLQRVGLDAGAAEALVAQLGERLASLAQRLVVPTLTASVGFALSLVIFVLLLYFLVVDWTGLAGFVHGVMPLAGDERRVLFKRAGERVKALVLGSLLVALVQGVVAGLGWWLLGLPSPLFWGFVMLVLEIVPVLGAFVVLLPATIWAFATGQVWVGLGLVVLNFVAVGLIDDWLRAWVVGRWTGIHPGVVLVGLAGGLPIFGLSGLILGPLLVSLLPLFLQAVAGAGSMRLADEAPDSRE